MGAGFVIVGVDHSCHTQRLPVIMVDRAMTLWVVRLPTSFLYAEIRDVRLCLAIFPLFTAGCRVDY